MRDRDVRAAILAHLEEEHGRDAGTRIVQEMGIWSGSVRIDVAVINGELCGYELKSDSDTLERLPAQAELYSRVFDRVSLVVGTRHLKKAQSLVPKWWGIIVANDANGAISLRESRPPKFNPNRDALLVARLLWRDEALSVLEERGLARGYRSKPAGVIHERLASDIPLAELSDFVRAALKSRTGWLGQLMRNNGKMTIEPNCDPLSPAASTTD